MRGISVVLETLLITFLLIALISLLWLFTSGTINAIGKSGTNQTQQVESILSTCAIVDSVHGDNIYIRNCGNGVITNDSLNVYADEVPIGFSLTPSTIGKGGTGTITANLWGLNNGDHYIKITNPSLQVVQEVEASLPDSCILALDFNEGSGSTVNDYSGNGNSGTIYARHENLIDYSQDFSNEAWGGYCGSKTNIVYNTPDVLAPDGTQTAAKFVVPPTIDCVHTTTSWGVLQTAVPPIVGDNYTVSVWLKGANGGELVRLGINDAYLQTFTLTNNWARYTYTGNNTYPGNRGLEFFDSTANDIYYAWGAQLEKENNASLYTATTNAPFNDGVIAYAGQFTPWTTGNFGKALQFDGIDDYVNVPDSSSLNINGTSFTITAWIYLNDYSKNHWGSGNLYTPILNRATNGWTWNNGKGYGLGICDSCGHILRLNLGWGNDIDSNLNIGLNQWYFVVASYSNNGSSVLFNVNGLTNSLTNQVGYNPVNYNLEIGYNDWAYDGLYFNGTIDSVRIYNQALTPDQITILKMR